jgi:hypothetical protein
MKRIVVLFAVPALVLSIGMIAIASTGIRSVGLRVILPFTGVPLYLGGEVVTEAPFGDLSFSLFLSPDGGTLLLGSADVALTDDESTATAFLRLTTGLAYFDPSRLLPTILLGAGTSVRFDAAHPLALSMTGELIYPLAFPIPMLTVSGGWALP